jgi:hypothetical protein
LTGSFGDRSWPSDYLSGTCCDKDFAQRVEAGHILCRPILGGLHHQYVRI